MENASLKGEVARLQAELGKANSKKATLSEERQKLQEQIEWHKKRFEELLRRAVWYQLQVKAGQKMSQHYHDELFEMQKGMFERGARRAEHDESYAIFRELLISGKSLTGDNLKALIDENPNADIQGLAMVAEEFGAKIDIDLITPQEKKYKVNITSEVQSVWSTNANKDG
jgi:hypothetical protein